MDAGKTGQLAFRDFVGALERMGVNGDNTGNLKSLYYNIDPQQSGFITLYDLDPEAADALDKFRYRCTSKYGSIENAWNTGLQQDCIAPSLGLHDFADGCAACLGYRKRESSDLFYHLLARPGATRVSLKDLDMLQCWEYAKKHLKEKQRMGCAWINKDPYLGLGEHEKASKHHRVLERDLAAARRVAPYAFEDLKNKQESAASKIVTATEPLGSYAMRLGTDHETGFSKFCEFLLRKFKSLASAYGSMNTSGSGMMSLLEFQSAVSRTLMYCTTPDARRLFYELSQDGQQFTWRDLGVTPQEWIAYLTEKKWQEQLKRNEQAKMTNKAMGGNPRHKHAVEDHLRRVQKQVPRPVLAFGQKPPSGKKEAPPLSEVMRPRPMTPPSIEPTINAKYVLRNGVWMPHGDINAGALEETMMPTDQGPVSPAQRPLSARGSYSPLRPKAEVGAQGLLKPSPRPGSAPFKTKLTAGKPQLTAQLEKRPLSARR
eukprot:TRINITY_DN6889_c0_g1_i1.p1 TRINITY_DN6889_c0_g1~~TRINITY_DN6889_c0_g1_i1.p1  ORF type:complete len:548 (-),score=72.74 TRINITY_DN6889_c0_g1_i1:284-1744(-)